MGTPPVESTEALYREHGAAVAAFCRSLLRDRGEAEDAAQQVFLSAHRALLNGTAPREPLAWLLAVARHECYARFRQRAAAPVPTGDAPEAATADASVHALRAGELASVWDEVGRMPPAQRDAFLLREIRGLSYRQLSDELSLSPPSVRSLLLRARARLRHRLGSVATAFGGAPWVQALVRLAGGDGASPVPAATKAVAVGLGALALTGVGDAPRIVHHAFTAPRHPVARHRSETHVHRIAATPVVPPRAVAPPVERPQHLDRQEHRSGGSGSSSSGSGSHDSGNVAATTSSSGQDGGSSSSSGSSSNEGPGSSSSGEGSGGTTTTTATTTITTTTTESGSDGGGDDGPSGSDGSGSGDGGHDGGGSGSGGGGS